MNFIQTSGKAEKKSYNALMSSVKDNLEELHSLFTNLCLVVSENQFLSDKICYMLIVTKPERISSDGEVFPKGFQIWALHKSDPSIERDIGKILESSIDGKLFFAAGANSKLALKKDGVEIIKEMHLK